MKDLGEGGTPVPVHLRAVPPADGQAQRQHRPSVGDEEFGAEPNGRRRQRRLLIPGVRSLCRKSSHRDGGFRHRARQDGTGEEHSSTGDVRLDRQQSEAGQGG